MVGEAQNRPLIVGAGPTGLAAALFLAHRRVETRVIEKELHRRSFSKALGVNPRTLALLEETGVTERLLAQGWRVQRMNLWRHGRVVAHLNLSKLNHRYPFMLVHSQAESERLLAEALAERGVMVERGVELVGARSLSDGAEAELRVAGGVHSVRAPWVLGADGAHSTVRKQLDVGFPGFQYDDPWKLYDLRMTTSFPADEGMVVLLDDGFIFALRVQDDVWRVLGNVADILKKLPGRTEQGEILWESDFTISHRLADQFAKGCVYLAGDAAHLHSPMGARGMNLGIEDAYVFATLAVEGKLGDYERLRRPVDAKVVRLVARLTEIPRGRGAGAKLVRWLLPWFGWMLSGLSGVAARGIVGLDHEVRLR